MKSAHNRNFLVRCKNNIVDLIKLRFFKAADIDTRSPLRFIRMTNAVIEDEETLSIWAASEPHRCLALKKVSPLLACLKYVGGTEDCAGTWQFDLDKLYGMDIGTSSVSGAAVIAQAYTQDHMQRLLRSWGIEDTSKWDFNGHTKYQKGTMTLKWTKESDQLEMPYFQFVIE